MDIDADNPRAVAVALPRVVSVQSLTTLSFDEAAQRWEEDRNETTRQ